MEATCYLCANTHVASTRHERKNWLVLLQTDSPAGAGTHLSYSDSEFTVF
jgi:hypothetical protein